MDLHTFFRAFTGATTAGIIVAYSVPVFQGWWMKAVDGEPNDGLVMASGILMSAVAICTHVTLHVLLGDLGDANLESIHYFTEGMTALGGALILASIVSVKHNKGVVEVTQPQIMLALAIGVTAALLLSLRGISW